MQQENQPRKLTPEQRAALLAFKMPCLAMHPEFLDPWDPLAMDEWSVNGASGGERLAVSFVLHVYNQHDKWKCGRFDMIEASTRLSPSHWAVVAEWAQNPFTL